MYNTGCFDHDIDHSQLKTEKSYILNLTGRVGIAPTRDCTHAGLHPHGIATTRDCAHKLVFEERKLKVRITLIQFTLRID